MLDPSNGLHLNNAENVATRLILLYKIVHSFIEIPTDYLPILSPITTTRSNHDYKFLHYYTSIDSYKYSFFPRTTPEWNKLPPDTINKPTIDSFKQSLFDHFCTHWHICPRWTLLIKQYNNNNSLVFSAAGFSCWCNK